MANKKKTARVLDTDIRRLNHVGLSLKAIADMLGCHPATITLRLKAMGVAPSDTRRSFMEEVFKHLGPDEQEWVSHFLFNNDISIRTFVADLVKDAYANAPTLAAPAPELPAMTPAPAQAAEVNEAADSVVAQLEAELQNDPRVEPELVTDTLEADAQPNSPCGTCGEAPAMTDMEICPGCHDLASRPAEPELPEEPVIEAVEEELIPEEPVRRASIFG